VAIGPQETTLVPNGARVMCAAIVLTCAAFEFGLIGWGHLDLTLRATPAVLLVAVLAIVLFWLPQVTLSHAGIEVVNPLRTYRVGWMTITDIGTRWSLTLEVGDRRITVWSAPAPGVLTGTHRADALETLYARSEGQDLGGLKSPLRRQGGAAGVVARQWDAHRESPHADYPIQVHWNRPAIAVLGALIVLTAIGAFWP
jgi:hypothetical protein